jgi:hypothetical protein
MSYFDFLTDDNFEKILNIRCDNIEKEIKKLEQKNEKLNEKIKPLFIGIGYNIDSDIPETMISYDRVEYVMDKYLFNSAFEFDGMFQVHLKYDDDWDQIGNGKAYYGDILINPTCFDVLVEINKGINTTKDFSHRWLEHLDYQATPYGSKGFYIINPFLGS